MTVLRRYLAAASESITAAREPVFDEFAAADGTARQGWSSLLAGLDEFADTDLLQAQHDVVRLLEDDNVTYTPNPASAMSIADEPNGHPHPDMPIPEGLVEPQPWRLDPLPLIIDDREWAGLEAGLVQRAQLLDAIMADLYGARRLLSRHHIPAAAIFDHDEYLRPLVGSGTPTGQRLFLVAADLGRDSSGGWKVISDRTQAPSGAGYAMQNRRVVSRVMPEIYHQANLHRLTPFFQAMRLALVDAAPHAVEDPRVVVLSPGTLSETAFDQAFVASLLGFPLLEGSDLTVRDGRVWMRVLDKLEQVDVILRRVDSGWMDALELRPDSRLGVAGLLACVAGDGQRVEQSRQWRVGESCAYAAATRSVRANARPITATALCRYMVVRRPVSIEPRLEQSGLSGHSADQQGSWPQRPGGSTDEAAARIARGQDQGGAASLCRAGDAAPVVRADERGRSAGSPQRGAPLVRRPQR